ncbi:MAG: DUF6485 family protein [Defluviitaleaceae bacterium]|nr:DUF6485 family protein [Defluviitaleaceae bacterium]
MEKHFCTCPVVDCPHNPNNPDNKDAGCEACMQKVLQLGEIPACCWFNIENGLKSTSEFSMGNFAKFYLEKSHSN